MIAQTTTTSYRTLYPSPEQIIPIRGQIVKMLLPSCQLSLADANAVLVTNFRYSISNINSTFKVGIRISQNHKNQVHQFPSYLVTDKARQRSDLGQIEKSTEDEGGGDGQGVKLWLEGFRNSARAG